LSAHRATLQARDKPHLELVQLGRLLDLEEDLRAVSGTDLDVESVLYVGSAHSFSFGGERQVDAPPSALGLRSGGGVPASDIVVMNSLLSWLGESI
jgi:hypothetical protein